MKVAMLVTKKKENPKKLFKNAEIFIFLKFIIEKHNVGCQEGVGCVQTPIRKVGGGVVLTIPYHLNPAQSTTHTTLTSLTGQSAKPA